MAAAAQAVWSVRDGLKNAGSNGTVFSPFAEADWELVGGITNGAVEVLLLQFIWFRTWGAKTQRRGEPPPLYSQAISYAGMATYAGCTRNNAEHAIQALIKRGLVEVVDADLAAKLGLPKPAATSKRQYRLRYDKWPNIKLLPKEKPEPEETGEDIEDVEDVEVQAVPKSKSPIGPGHKGKLSLVVSNDQPAITLPIWNTSSVAQAGVADTEHGQVILISDRNKGVTTSAIPAHGDSAEPVLPKPGVREGRGPQPSPAFSNTGKSGVANNGVNGSTIPAHGDSEFARFYGLFEENGKQLSAQDRALALKRWNRIPAQDRPRVIAWAAEQFRKGIWRITPNGEDYIAFPAAALSTQGWLRAASLNANTPMHPKDAERSRTVHEVANLLRRQDQLRGRQP